MFSLYLLFLSPKNNQPLPSKKKKKTWHESRILKFIRKECVNNMRLPWGVT
jgi:hypothetical protein